MVQQTKFFNIILFSPLTLLLALGGCGGGSGDGSTSGAILTWDAPTTNVDRTCLADLGGYKVYYGISTGDYSYTEKIDINGISCEDTGVDAGTNCGTIKECTYIVDNLSSGTWYFAVTAYDTSGNESDYSNEVSKEIL